MSTDHDRTLERRVLGTFSDLEQAGLLEPAPQKVVLVRRLREHVPERLIFLVETELERMAAIVFRIRIAAQTSSELAFLTELADVIYQLAKGDGEEVPEARAAADRLGITHLGVFVALALYAKGLMMGRGIISQPDQMVIGSPDWCYLNQYLLADLPREAPTST